jgi:hypothetical protein
MTENLDYKKYKNVQDFFIHNNSGLQRRKKNKTDYSALRSYLKPENIFTKL